tara:strand:+ start:3046 stop:3633 length:588 start_codon:yes stop_codon:yes gene_type:complete
MKKKSKGVKGLSKNDLRLLSILFARRDEEKRKDRDRLMNEEGSSSNRQTAAQKILEDFKKGGPQMDPTHRDWDKLTYQYDDMSDLGMTPGSKLLDEELSRDLLREQEILKLGDRIDRMEHRTMGRAFAVGDYNTGFRKFFEKKKKFDPADQDQVTKKEMKKRKKEETKVEPQRSETRRKIRDEMEAMLRNNSGKE